VGIGHGHSDAAAPRLRVTRWSKTIVVGLIVLSGLAAVLGVLRWWPDEKRVDGLHDLIPFAAAGTDVVHGQLVAVLPSCDSSKTAGKTSCGDSKVKILDGDRSGQIVPITLTADVTATGLRAGDHVLLLETPPADASSTQAFSFYRVQRGEPMIWLAVLFVLAVVAVAWRRGMMALLSLGFAGLVVVGYLIPALLSGQPAVPVALAASVLILIVMLYVTHGLSMRTSVALAGALIGIGLSTLFASLGIIGSRLAGYGDDAAGLLSFNVSWVDVQQLVIASVILAGLGTLNDVTVTQASALWELRGAAPLMSRWELFRSAMRIGRDHVASTVYTLVFAYLGTALVLLVAVQLYGGTAYDFLTAEDVAEEIVRTLVGGLALVLAMPITTAIGALVVAGAVPAIDGPESFDSDAKELAHSARDATRRMADNPWAEG
jgi:uncharacterized membrane protein